MSYRIPFFAACRAVTALVLLGLLLPVPFVQAQNEKKDEPKPEQKKDEKKKDFVFPDIDMIIKSLPANLPAEQVERIRQNLEQAKKRVQEAQDRAERLRKLNLNRPIPKVPNINPPFANRFGPGSANRLGARLQKPNDTLVAQLGLAQGKGIVLEDVPQGSVAAKAGFKSSDILVELNGKEVPSEPTAFVTMLNDIKANTAVDAVVLRGGKRETIKGITIPEGSRPAERARGRFPF